MMGVFRNPQDFHVFKFFTKICEIDEHQIEIFFRFSVVIIENGNIGWLTHLVCNKWNR